MPSRDRRSGPGPGVFLCYRRGDTSDIAARLNDKLAAELGEARVFVDVRRVEPGVNFRLQGRDAIRGSAAMLVLIGPVWLTVIDDQGRRRLDDPGDHVRSEIEEGLLRGLRVIPVLTDGAAMPRAADLPTALAPLAELSALHIAHTSYQHDDRTVVTTVVEQLRDRRGRRVALVVGGLVTVLAVLGGLALALRPAGPGPVAPPTASAPTATGVPTASIAPSSTTPDTGEPGTASIGAEYDRPGGCSSVATITGDLHGDPRAAGHVLWLVAVLDSPPNVLHYPKQQVTAPDGRFTVRVDLNTEQGERRGRFALVVSPTAAAAADLQRSLQADVDGNDAAYPDDLRTRLRAGNAEIAATPFVGQVC